MCSSDLVHRWWILGAILAHAWADAGTASYQSGVVSVVVAQGRALIVTIILVLAVRKLYVSTTVPLARGGAQAS